MSKLNESVMVEVEKLYEAEVLKTMDLETVTALLESEGKMIPDHKLESALAMFQIQEKALNETNVSSNVATFTKKIQPLLRRTIPNQIAFDITGVQPVDGPDSSIFGIKSRYAGSTTTPIVNTAILINHDDVTAVAVGDQIASAGTGVATVKYVEAGKLIAEITAGAFVEGEEFDVSATFLNDGNENLISAIYTTETAFKQILKNYSGPYTTAVGEALGDDMNQIKVTIEKIPVSVKTRALKAQFTMELVTDMRNMHGANADNEIMKFLETEIILDLDREVIDTYKGLATAIPTFAVATSTASQGRWSLEMYAGLYQRISFSANSLVSKNRRGKGNILVCTAGVIVALESLGKFKTTDYATSVKTAENQAQTFVGTLSNGMKVYQDHFSTTEYAMIIYKGDQNLDAGLFYSPYSALEFVNAVDAKTLQPVVGLRSRYALTPNTLMDDEAGSSYAEMFTVDFANTPLTPIA